MMAKTAVFFLPPPKKKDKKYSGFKKTAESVENL